MSNTFDSKESIESEIKSSLNDMQSAFSKMTFKQKSQPYENHDLSMYIPSERQEFMSYQESFQKADARRETAVDAYRALVGEVPQVYMPQISISGDYIFPGQTAKMMTKLVIFNGVMLCVTAVFLIGVGINLMLR